MPVGAPMPSVAENRLVHLHTLCLCVCLCVLPMPVGIPVPTVHHDQTAGPLQQGSIGHTEGEWQELTDAMTPAGATPLVLVPTDTASPDALPQVCAT